MKRKFMTRVFAEEDLWSWCEYPDNDVLRVQEILNKRSSVDWQARRTEYASAGWNPSR